MHVREATHEDLPAIRAIAEGAYARYLPRMDRRPAPMDADFAAAQQAGSLMVASMGGEVLGYVLCYAEGAAWQIDNLAVAPQAQGRGLATALLAVAEGKGRAAGATRLTLYTNIAMTEAMAVYEKLGFAEVGRRREDGFDRVFYSREIAPQGD